VINIGDIAHEICPRYPDIEEVPPLWNQLAGQYEFMARPSSVSANADVLGHSNIWVADGVLQMGGVVGPLLPISETEIIIQSGPRAVLLLAKPWCMNRPREISITIISSLGRQTQTEYNEPLI
ncbi:MAG: hypothetical protein ACYTGA_08725, partial [Planctomycetota bacterium]